MTNSSPKVRGCGTFFWVAACLRCFLHASEPYDYTREDHVREVERALMYIEQAQRKCEEIARSLVKEGAEERLITGLWTASAAMKAEHNRLLNRSHFPVPDQPEAAEETAEADATLLDASGEGPRPDDQQKMAI